MLDCVIVQICAHTLIEPLSLFPRPLGYLPVSSVLRSGASRCRSRFTVGVLQCATVIPARNAEAEPVNFVQLWVGWARTG